MLKITLYAREAWDEQKQEFISSNEQTLLLEHSLLSLSKWESKWHKAFLTKDPRTEEESIDYIRCMTLNEDEVDPKIYNLLSQEQVSKIYEYINNPMTATTFNNRQNQRPNDRTIVTSELIYYWMVSLGIPFECEKWHLNRLITLIRVCEVKNGPSKKMSRRDVMSQYSELNRARRKQFNSKG